MTELFCLTRTELLGLHRQIVSALPQLPEGSAERHTAVINLRNIRRVLAQHHFVPH
ncbi:MAG: hypothetical protein ACLQME_13715 [Alphaproteobacteria bacterium]